MHSFKATYKVLILSWIIFAVVACSVEKNTGATRFYHGMTAHYNIYFNGYESFKAGVDKVMNNYTDDYAEILRVFEFSDPGTPALCSSDMEKAIQKASKLISLKSITAKPEVKGNKALTEEESDLLNRKEYNEWVDDSYLLIATARFYKHEYGEASKLFDYCIAQANDSLIKKEAAVWQARICNETGKYTDSYRILTELGVTSGSPKALKSMYYTTLADLFIKQKKYQEAIDPLSSAIKMVKGKHGKYRYTYLLAQLNEITGNTSRAISLYQDVVKLNPPYDVEFNARINIAGVFDVASGNPEEIRRELDKMLKDTKNKDFLDQIYYVLGTLSMKEGKEEEALQYFRKSALAPSRNPNQKGRSYLALAEYFYNKPDFLKAGKYYDSTVFFLDEKYPDYQKLKTKSLNLNSVVSQIKIIQTEDSLQRVAAMPESDRNVLISNIINDITTAEKEGRTSEYSDRYNLGQFYENERRFQNNIEQEGKWYFYNQSALTFGRTEFRRRWGDRKLEDNWRRANKTRTSTTGNGNAPEEGSATVKDTSKAVLDYKSPEFYLKNLPLTDSLLVISKNKIAVACLNAGKAYSEKIDDPVRATESFEMLINRYPDHELVPEALYNLYKVNLEKNATKAETYRQRLLQNFPQSEFSKILTDPDYYEKKLADKKLSEKLYEEAYNSYLKEEYQSAIKTCESALSQFGQDALAPKFMLLHAYSVARIRDERAFREELSNLIKQWPNSEESNRANEIISFIDKKMPELKIEEDKAIAEELFTIDTTAIHSFILIIANPAFNINQATFDVISYNIDNYTNNNYRTQGELVENKYFMISVSGFRNFSQTLDYYKKFSVEKIIRNPSASKIYSFIINNANQEVIKKDLNPERYLLFFKEKYLNEKN